MEALIAGMALLQLGQAGAMIIILQQMLNRAGIGPLLELNGLFNLLTQAAVERYQAGRGEEATGLVDAALLIALLTQGLDERRGQGPCSPRTAPRFGAARPEGSTPASRFLEADEARRRGRPASPSSGRRSDGCPAGPTGTDSVTPGAVAPSGPVDAQLAGLQSSAVESARRELANGVRADGQNRSARVDQYARDGGMNVGGPWCGYFTGFNYNEAARAAGGRFTENVRFHSMQKARSYFEYRNYTNNSRTENDRLDRLQARQTAEGSPRRWMVLSGSGGERHATSNNRPHETFEPSNLPIREGDTALFSRGHVGLVESYDRSTGRLTTIEGNSTNRRVCRNTYDLNNPVDRAKFEGFGRPARSDFAVGDAPAANTDSARAPAEGSPMARPSGERPEGTALGQRVLLLGDSHTVGEFGRSLEQALEADGRTVERHAMVGASASTHLPTVAADIRASSPDSIVVVLGGNFRGASQAQVRSQVDRMVGEIARSGSDANVTWVGPPRRRVDAEDGGASLRRFDAMVRSELEAAGERHGVSTRFISSEPLSSYSGPDGIHYNHGPAREWSGRVRDELVNGGTAPLAARPGAVDGRPADAPSGSSDVTAAELRQIAPRLSEDRANELVPHLNRAMRDANITTERQRAAFIAQLSAESGGFRWFEELASGEAYEGRAGLGNTEPGDGVRYKGRGPIQLTGRANYRAAGRALGLDLENNPELVATPEVGFRVAAWFWNSRGLNAIAERGDFREVTRRINGGYNGLEARTAYYDRALGVLA